MRALYGSRGPIALVAALLALLVPNGATAATVANGDFESGSLHGWQVHRAIQAGNWFAYRGTNAPIGGKRGADPVQRPPQGDFAGIADQANPDTLILYQDIALERGRSHQLGMVVYYDSYAPIAIPSPDTLSVDQEVLGGGSNQQYRIDVMKPDAPLESLNPADILQTVFRTKKGDPTSLPPTRVTADLTRFAGQTVRLRVASAVTDEVLNAGVDAIEIVADGSRGSQPSGGSKRGPSLFSFGKIKTNRRNGTATLQVQTSGRGLLTAKGAPSTKKVAGASQAKAPQMPIQPVAVLAPEAKTVTLRLRPNPLARKTLKRTHKLRIEVAVTFWPAGSAAETATVPVTLRSRPSS
ncbi:MAG: hypothetical protein WA687_01825 [Solirubrobacterales bacterium]